MTDKRVVFLTKLADLMEEHHVVSIDGEPSDSGGIQIEVDFGQQGYVEIDSSCAYPSGIRKAALMILEKQLNS